MGQRNLDGLPPELVKALEKGREIDAELRQIVMERDKLDEQEMRLLEEKAGLNKRAERGNARPESPGKAGKDTGRTPMPQKDNKSIQAPRQVHRQPEEYQLSLFYYDVVERYSNVIQLYNEIPKYVCDAPRDQKHLESLEREFTVEGVRYRVVLHPARLKIKGKNGKKDRTVEQFIGTREELVEDAITKIAIDKRRLFTMSDTTRVDITIHEIQKELERIKHKYSYAEIKEAIEVLGGARMIVEDQTGNSTWGTSTYPDYLLSTDSKDGKGNVQLHALVSEAIKQGLYRQYDYTLAMGLKGRYARRLYKLLALKFTWAKAGGTGAPYTLHLKSFLSKHGFKIYAKFSDNAKKFRMALEELKSARIIMSWTEDQKKKGRKIEDYTFKLISTPEFGGAMRRAQGITKDIEKRLNESKST